MSCPRPQCDCLLSPCDRAGLIAAPVGREAAIPRFVHAVPNLAPTIIDGLLTLLTECRPAKKNLMSNTNYVLLFIRNMSSISLSLLFSPFPCRWRPPRSILWRRMMNILSVLSWVLTRSLDSRTCRGRSRKTRTPTRNRRRTAAAHFPHSMPNFQNMIMYLFLLHEGPWTA